MYRRNWRSNPEDSMTSTPGSTTIGHSWDMIMFTSSGIPWCLTSFVLTLRAVGKHFDEHPGEPEKWWRQVETRSRYFYHRKPGSRAAGCAERVEFGKAGH